MADSAATLRQLLDSQRFAVLATESSGQPHTSLMAFAATRDLADVVIVTERDTHKYAHLADNSRVALLIDDRTNKGIDTQTGTAVTALGHAMEAPEPERAELLTLFLAKHPTMADFASSPSCAVVRLRVDVYQIVTQFRNVALHFPGEAAAVSTPGEPHDDLS